MMDFENSFQKIESDNKLERERGQKAIIEYIKKSNDLEIVDFLESELAKIPNITKCTWQKSFAIIVLIKSLVLYSRLKIKNYLLVILACLEHPEARVRTETGDLIEIICKQNDRDTNTEILKKVLVLINENISRNTEPVSRECSFGVDETQKLIHDTCGWRFLETSLHALHCIFKHCIANLSIADKSVTNNINTESIDYIFRVIYTKDWRVLVSCSRHPNRFVREKIMFVFESLFCTLLIEHIYAYLLKETIDGIYICLCDNWSQVRLAASQAARKFIFDSQIISDKNQSKTDIKKLVNKLLPPICLNRHYLAEGVKIYNVKTWEMVTRGLGLDLVRNKLDIFVPFYVSQANADNHAVREASCHCLTELAYLLGPSLNESHIKIIYECLLVCLNDDSWPVRDTALWALGVNMSYHKNFFSDKISILFPYFCRNLTDSIHSVRTGASVSLTYVFNTYPQIIFDFINKFLDEKLVSVKNQKSDVEKHQNLSKEPALFGVVMDAEDYSHCNQTMYSCCSLAPRMKSGSKNAGGGCSSSHNFVKEPQPWEISDGCLIFLGELAKFYSMDSEKYESKPESHFKMDINIEAKKMAVTLISSKLTSISEVLEFKSFDLHTNIYSTFYTYIPFVFDILGIKNLESPQFKIFIEPIKYGYTAKINQNLKISSDSCFERLVKSYGRSSLIDILQL